LSDARIPDPPDSIRYAPRELRTQRHTLLFIYVSTYVSVVPTPGLAFEVLSDRTRLRIVEQLRGGERSVGALVSTLSVCQPGISRHLRILHDRGFVRVRADGQRRLYSLRPQPFRDLDRWMDDYRDLVEDRLDRLERLVEADRPESHSPKRESRRG
jgi:DNA-binding transcriptional ArsR family regulator